jgi:hypothetical protein
MILGLTGHISSGKDTVADFLVEQYGFCREAFAAILKDVLSDIFGWDREMLEGRTKEQRAKREQVDTWWSNRLGIPQLTPRWVLQNFGTDTCRRHFHDDIWIAALENKLRTSSGNIVITDARFPNELSMVRRLGGQCWVIERGIHPVWYEYARSYNAATIGRQIEMKRIANEQKEPNIFNQNIHQSEWAWVGYPFDQTISNNGSIAELHSLLDSKLIGLE